MFSNLRNKRLKGIKNLEAVAVDLYNKLIELPVFKKLSSDERKATLKNLFGEDTQDILFNKKNADVDTAQNAKDICLKFFGLNENWSLGKNLFIGALVQLPDIPSYFMPAYTQSKSTGDAKALKKGEGTRGLLTGSLEGVAVGALVSGRKLVKNPLTMVPYILLGAGVQFISSKIFPFIGEKAGQYFYRKNHPSPNTKIISDLASNSAQKPAVLNTNKSALNTYPKQNIQNNSGLKI